jgi:hypothetical protein
MTKSKGGVLGVNPRVRMLSIDRIIKPGGDPSRTIENLYSYGRTYPREQPAEWPKAPTVNDAVARQGRHVSKGDPYNENTNQDVTNWKSPHYDNDSRGWVRGAANGQKASGNSETAERLPNFDHSRDRPSMQSNKGNDWRKK